MFSLLGDIFYWLLLAMITGWLPGRLLYMLVWIGIFAALVPLRRWASRRVRARYVLVSGFALLIFLGMYTFDSYQYAQAWHRYEKVDSQDVILERALFLFTPSPFRPACFTSNPIVCAQAREPFIYNEPNRWQADLISAFLSAGAWYIAWRLTRPPEKRKRKPKYDVMPTPENMYNLTLR